MAVLTDIRNRGVRDTVFVVCDGLKGLAEVVGNVWPQATVQAWIVHLIRKTIRLASMRYWADLKRDLRPIYTAINADPALEAFGELTDKWEQRYPAIIRLWLPSQKTLSRSWITTWRSATDLQHQRHRVPKRPLPPGGGGPRPFSPEQAHLKCLYLVARSLDPSGTGRTRWTMRWKPALNAFADRIPAAETYCSNRQKHHS
jgi:putative transposase